MSAASKRGHNTAFERTAFGKWFAYPFEFTRTVPFMTIPLVDMMGGIVSKYI